MPSLAVGLPAPKDKSRNQENREVYCSREHKLAIGNNKSTAINKSLSKQQNLAPGHLCMCFMYYTNRKLL